MIHIRQRKAKYDTSIHETLSATERRKKKEEWVRAMMQYNGWNLTPAQQKKEASSKHMHAHGHTHII